VRNGSAFPVVWLSAFSGYAVARLRLDSNGATTDEVVPEEASGRQRIETEPRGGAAASKSASQRKGGAIPHLQAAQPRLKQRLWFQAA